MPPVKPNLKAVARAALNARFVNVPSIGSSPSYPYWLRELLETPQNRKNFITAEKTEVDDLLRVQAGREFKKDTSLLNIALAQVHSRVLSG
jgi:hypothetical protein